MIPILFEPKETEFITNGIGLLYDCISCQVTEERNGIYELEMEYPVTGAHFNDISLGSIIGAEHDENQDIQPFDIYAFTKPLNGIVTFYAHHISYRLRGSVAKGTGITTVYDAFYMFRNAVPSNPFRYESDIFTPGVMSSANGLPHTVRDYLGGIEGSMLDTWGGEYEFDKFIVKLLSSRGEVKDIKIRYGVNMTDFSYDSDYSELITAVVPYWTDGTNSVIGNIVYSGLSPFDYQEICVPLDVSDKFESQPQQADVEAAGLSYMMTNQTYLPLQTIKVKFINLSDSEEYKQYEELQKCCLCDSITVVFPFYNVEGTFKIVKVVWDVIQEKYTEMELGNLPITLAKALGIN